MELELTDVGFGISQVLPILVQAYLSPKNSITIIEQPEIHLNPKMQAWLIDAIISISLNESKNFIIETHSETIIRRLRLRIVDQNSKLTPSNLNIYHLERNNNDGTTDLNKATIDTTGDLIWPKEFMDINAQDLLEIQKMKFDMKTRRNTDMTMHAHCFCPSFLVENINNISLVNYILESGSQFILDDKEYLFSYYMDYAKTL